MVAGAQKSRSKRRVFKKSPGGRTEVKYLARKPSIAKCVACGNALKGVPRAGKTELKHMPKTSKRPERPFGGVLCAGCARQEFKANARS